MMDGVRDVVQNMLTEDNADLPSSDFTCPCAIFTCFTSEARASVKTKVNVDEAVAMLGVTLPSSDTTLSMLGAVSACGAPSCLAVLTVRSH